MRLFRKTKSLLRLLLHARARPELRIYSYDAKAAADINAQTLFSRDTVEHFYSYVPEKGERSQQDFVCKALKALERGMHSYTMVEEGRLLHCGWAIPRHEEAHLPEVCQTFKLPPGSAYLLRFYTSPVARCRGLYTASLRQILHEVGLIPGTKRIFITVLASNGASRHVIERVGFEYERSFYGPTNIAMLWRRFLGRLSGRRQLGL